MRLVDRSEAADGNSACCRDFFQEEREKAGF
jgi:hypothetical protein